MLSVISDEIWSHHAHTVFSSNIAISDMGQTHPLYLTSSGDFTFSAPNSDYQSKRNDLLVSDSRRTIELSEKFSMETVDSFRVY